MTPPPPPPTPATLPDEILEAISGLLEAARDTEAVTVDGECYPPLPEAVKAYHAARVALESAITAALASAEERARRAEGERDEARSRLSDMLIGWSSPEDVTETTRRHLADLAALRAERDALATKALAFAKGAEVRSWPPGFRLRDDLIAAAKAALAATPSSPRTAGDEETKP
jgi:hypothetical protein